MDDFRDNVLSLEDLAAEGNEPSHDPTKAIAKALDAGAQPTTPVEPLRLLLFLLQNYDLSIAERDAGEIFHRIASASISELPATTRHDIPWKNAEGKWSRKVMTRNQAKAALEIALAAIKSDNRRRAVMAALGARETSVDWASPHRLVAGLEDLARHWIGWQQPAKTVVNRHGVTMPKSLGPNDATDERMGKAENDNDLSVVNGARRINNWPFERMKARKQIDRDAGINELLFAAGLRYFQDWHFAGMSEIAVFDPAKPMVDGGRQPGGAIPERQLERMQAFSEACEALGHRYRQVVDPIVIEEKTVADIRHSLTGHRDRTAATAVAIERLNTGLRRLAVHYGLMRLSSQAA